MGGWVGGLSTCGDKGLALGGDGDGKREAHPLHVLEDGEGEGEAAQEEVFFFLLFRGGGGWVGGWMDRGDRGGSNEVLDAIEGERRMGCWAEL